MSSAFLTGFTARVLSPERPVEASNVRKHGNYNESVDRFPTSRRSLPLPRGEGRGEGERKSNYRVSLNTSGASGAADNVLLAP